MSASTYAQYADGELHEIPVERPDTFRAGLYLYARRHELDAKSYVRWAQFPLPVVVFRLGKVGTLELLPNAPPRGHQSHRGSGA